jgi:hypothetical protein
MKRFQEDIPNGQEEFLYFVLSTNKSLQSIINYPSHPNTTPLLFSSAELAEWTVSNWNWAVCGVVSCSEYINILYTHSRILNHEYDQSHYAIAHFHRSLPIYNYFTEQYQML